MNSINELIKNSKFRMTKIDEEIHIKNLFSVTNNFYKIQFLSPLNTDIPILAGDSAKLIFNSTENNNFFRKLTLIKNDTSKTLDFYLAKHEGELNHFFEDKLINYKKIQILGRKQEWALGEGIEKCIFLADSSSLAALSEIIRYLQKNEFTNFLIFLKTIESEDSNYFLDTVPKNKIIHVNSIFEVKNLLSTNLSDKQQFWLAGEAKEISDLKMFLISNPSVDKNAIKAKGYWKKGLSYEEYKKTKINHE